MKSCVSSLLARIGQRQESEVEAREGGEVGHRDAERRAINYRRVDGGIYLDKAL